MNSTQTRSVLFAFALLCSLPPIVAAQFAGGPKPVPRPDGPYSINGKIVNGMTSTPIPGAEISISTGSQGLGPVFEIAESGPDGSFRINRLPEGKYTLKAERRGFAGQAYLQHENYWSGIAVGPGKDSRHVVFPLFPSAVITGRVTDENGEGVRSATVKLWKRVFDNGKLDVEMSTEVGTDDRGIYRFDHLAAGKYAVSVRATPWYGAAGATTQSSERWRRSLASNSVGNEGDESEALDAPPGMPTGLSDVVYPLIYYPHANDLSAASWLELQPGEEESADFQLLAITGVRLLVRYKESEQNGQPVLAAVEGEAGLGQENPLGIGKVVSPGVMEFSGLAPGKYRVNIPDGENGARRNQDVDLGGDAEFDFREASSPGPKWTGEIEFSSGAQGNAWADLQLRDENARPIDASVPLDQRIYNDNGEAQSASRVQKGYSFSFQGVPPGKGVYDLGVAVPLGGTIESLEAKGAAVTGLRITTEGGDVHLKVKASVSEILLQGAAKKKGEPFAGAMMLLLPENGGPQLVRRDQSDSDGTFALPNVVPGKYKLLALEHGWEMPWADPEQQKALLPKGMSIEISRATAPAPVIVEVQ